MDKKEIEPTRNSQDEPNMIADLLLDVAFVQDQLAPHEQQEAKMDRRYEIGGLSTREYRREIKPIRRELRPLRFRQLDNLERINREVAKADNAEKESFFRKISRVVFRR